MSIFEQVAFKAPNYSVYNLGHDCKTTFPIGEVIPAMHVDVAPGERFAVSVEQLTRFAPLLAPTMHNFRLYVDSVFVPYRILGEDYENAFNYAKDEATHLIKSYDFLAFLKKNHGRLLDYLNFPTFDKARELVLSALNNRLYPGRVSFEKLDDSGNVQSVTVDSNSLNWLSIPINEDDCRILLNSVLKDNDRGVSYYAFLLLRGSYDGGYTPPVESGGTINVPGYSSDAIFAGLNVDANVGSQVPFRPFFGWFVMDKLPTLGVVDAFNVYLSTVRSGVDAFGELCSRYDLQPDALVAEYVDYVFSFMMYSDSSAVNLVNWGEVADNYSFISVFMPFFESGSVRVNALELKTYWKAILDWYINTNIDGDGEDLYQNFVDWFNGTENNPAFDYANPMVRRWESDYFTSCFPDGTVPAVPIPANPTVIDLRASNKMQKMDERTLYAGKRPQDQNLAHFGVVSSNARFDRTEVLSRRIFDIDINAVTQTNQSEFNKALKSPMGSYAGQGISVDLGQFLFDYTAEERGMIHVFVSVRPVSSYFQGLSKQSTKTSRFDFLTPILADVGESIVKTRELYCDLGLSDLNETFGYNRQYAEYMFMPSETHGAFRNSLRHWTGSRFIDVNRAVLDKSFIGVIPDSAHDDINRIFATGAGDTVLMYMYFHISAARPLSRMVNYSL